MLKKSVLVVIAVVFLITISIPFASSFSGSGDDYNTTGTTGYGAGSGSGDGYDISFGAYPQPTASGSGDGYTAESGFYFNVTEGEPSVQIELLTPSGDSDFARNLFNEFTVRVTCGPDADCGEINVTLDPDGIPQPRVAQLQDCDTIAPGGYLDCGETITQSCELDHGLTGCTGHGIVMGADDIVLDCKNHLLNGTRNSSSYGVDVRSVSNVTVNNCTISNFGRGIYIYISSDNKITNNNVTRNSQRGIRIDSSHNTLINNTVSLNSFYNIEFFVGYYNVLINNTINRSQSCIYMYSSGRNQFINNTITGCNYATGGAGLLIWGNSNENNATGNDIYNNNYGVRIYLSNQNKIFGNFITDNNYAGINISEGSNNTIYNNYFNNTLNAMDAGNNYWNTTKDCASGTNIIDGPCMGGNSWSDFDGNDTTGDGLADTGTIPYTGYGNITTGGDYLPLVVAVEPPPVPPNSTEFGTEYGSTNFSAVPDITNVTNMTLATQHGKIQFAEDYGVDADGEDYDSYIQIGNNFISVNTTALDSTFNHTANLSINNVVCPSLVYYGDNIYTTAQDILNEANQCNQYSEPQCTNIECIGNKLTFTINHFTGFASTSDVSGCGITLDSPGLWALGNDINQTGSGYCLTVGADDIILDCGGHSLTGSDSGRGIHAEGRNNITVRNCNITDFQHGAYFYNVNNSLFDNNMLNSNQYATYVTSSDNMTIKDNQFTGSSSAGVMIQGLAAPASKNVTIINNTISYGAGGIFLYHTDINNAITNNTIVNNTGNGISIYCTSNNNVTENWVENNSWGIIVSEDEMYCMFGGNARNNLIYNNYFDNTNNAYDDSVSPGNDWNIPTKDCASGPNIVGWPCKGGNYWSDYEGRDGDGDKISDSPLPYATNINIGGDYLPLELELGCGDGIANNTVLTKDLECFEYGPFFVADNVVLDCAGHNMTSIWGGPWGVSTGTSASSPRNNLTIKNCVISDFARGIRIIYTENSTFFNNTLVNNIGDGFYIEDSYNNNLTGNNITNNTGYGINVVEPVANNMIWNNFLNNTNNVYDDSVAGNNWNTTLSCIPDSWQNIIGGDCMGGNFWSDYNGTDGNADGVGDTELPWKGSTSITTGGDWLPLTLGKGIIPYGSGTPFWTNTSNPYTISLNAGESQDITFWVNATGDVGAMYKFFAYAYLTSNLSIRDQTDKINVTIIEALVPSVSIQLVTPNESADFTRNELSQFTVNVTCGPDADCGEINVTLDPFSGGDGSPGSPYEITNCTDLQAMKDNLTAHYILTQDIDCSDTATWNWNGSQYLGFAPIGNSTNYPSNVFSGNFDGQNHTISGLYINRPSNWYIGLFGYVGQWSGCTLGVDCGEIKNVGLIDVNITGGPANTGGLVGLNYGIVENTFSTGTVVTGNVMQPHVGGLVAQNYGTISNSYSSAYVYSSSTNPNSHIGGLVGYTGDWRGYGNITNCYATGNVSVNGEVNVGGLSGTNLGAIITDCYATGNVSGGSGNNNVGGLVGMNSGTVTGSFATGGVSDTGGDNFIGSLIGDNYGTITGGYWNNHTENPEASYFIDCSHYSANESMCTSVSGCTWNVSMIYCEGKLTGNENCTAIQDNESYFYYSSNPPMNTWDFTNIWQETPGGFPGLKGFEVSLPDCDTIAPGGYLDCGETITQSCELDHDLTGCTGDGINIGTDDTILDCAGHSINGTRAISTYGINATMRNNITIKNCRASNFYAGIKLRYVNNSHVSDSSSINNTYYGLNLYTLSYNNTISNFTSSGNYREAILLDYAYDNVLTDIDVSNNLGTSYPGINLASSNNNTLMNVNSSNNLNQGIRIYWSKNNTLINVNSFNNSGYGFYFYANAQNNTLSNFNSNSNSYGIYFYSNCHNNTIRNGIIQQNQNYGIYFQSASTSTGNIFFNNFLDNPTNVYDPQLNYWNTTYNCTAGPNIMGGSCIGGNFWSDFDGTDTTGDGIADTGTIPYTGYGNITTGGDYLPLAGAFPAPPSSTEFGTEYGSTNFSAVPDITNVTNMTLATQHGKIHFAEDYGVDADGEDYDSYIQIGDNFISVDTTALDSTFNHSANLTINNVVCPATIYYGDGVYTTSKDIIEERNVCNETSSPSCTVIDCSGSNVTFTVSHFTGFGVMGYGYKGGKVPVGSGTPFWTNTSNPYTITLNAGQSQLVTFWVNATGEGGNMYEFFAYANLTSYPSIGNQTDRINVTIVEPFKCGDTIYEDTILTVDLTGCPGHGLILGADNITLYCQGHSIGGSNSGYDYGIYLNSVNNVTIKNCTVYNFSEAGIYIGSGSKNTLLNNKAVNNTYYGINIVGSDNNLTSNTANNNNYAGIYLSSSNNNLTSNTANNNYYGIYLSASSSNTLTNNGINNNSENGIHISSGSNNNLIYNNYLNNSVNAFDIGTNNWNTALNCATGPNILGYPCIGGNFWSDYTGWDENGDGMGDTFVPHKSGGNILVGGDYLPLTTPLACGVTIDHDLTLGTDLSQTGEGTCITIGADDITLDCAGFNIDGDDTYLSHAINATGRDNITIKNCNVTDFGDGSIYIFGTNNSLLYNNTVTSGADNGMWIQSTSNNVIESNTLKYNGNNGMSFYSNSNTTVFNNTISNNLGDEGLKIFQSHFNNFTDNTINDNDGGLGVSLSQSSNNRFVNNIVNSSRDYGFLISNSDNNTFFSNTVNYSGWEGFEIEISDYNNFTSNTASHNSDGFYLSSSSNNILASNTANNNTDTGIYISMDSNHTTLASNTANNNSQYGIQVRSSSYNNITSSKVRHNTYGIFIFISSRFNNLTFNNASYNQYGIAISSASTNNTLTSNTANNNQYGIHLFDSNSNVLTSNNASYNQYGITLDFNSNYNTLTSNNISQNDYGVYLQSASINNLIYNNYFNNSINAFDIGTNYWNTTYSCIAGSGQNIIGKDCMGGNFWNNYFGFDDGSGSYPHNISADKIGDTNIPYNASGNIAIGGDYLPLLIISIIPPNTEEILVNATSTYNQSSDSLNCWARGVDENSTDLTAYYVWYNGSSVYSSGSLSVVNDTFTLISGIDSSITRANETWTCSVKMFDGIANETVWNNGSIYINYYLTNLTISSNAPRTILETVTFLADYTRVDTGQDVQGATCTIRFSDGQEGTMTFGAGVYEYTRTFTVPDNYTWNVTCEKEEHVTQFRNDTAEITLVPTTLAITYTDLQNNVKPVLYPGDLVRFWAIYRTDTNQNIVGADCNISFNVSEFGPFNMTYYGDGRYFHDRVFFSEGLYEWNVTCAKLYHQNHTLYDTVNISKPMAKYLDMRLIVPGIPDDLSFEDPYYSVSKLDDDTLFALVFHREIPEYAQTFQETQNHTLWLRVWLEDSEAFLVFTEGQEGNIKNRLELIEDLEFMEHISPSFGFGLGLYHPLKVMLMPRDIDIQSDMFMERGEHMLVVESNRTGTQKAIVLRRG